jgi:hypothetical protein
MALSKLLRVMRGAVGCLWLATAEKARPGVLPGVPPLPPTLPCSSCLAVLLPATSTNNSNDCRARLPQGVPAVCEPEVRESSGCGCCCLQTGCRLQ